MTNGQISKFVICGLYCSEIMIIANEVTLSMVPRNVWHSYVSINLRDIIGHAKLSDTFFFLFNL